MGPVGVPEMFAILAIALILFGPKKLPELAKTLGKAMHEFRKAKNELKNTFETHMQELEKETRMITTDSSPTPNYTSGPKYSSGYSYPYEDYQHDSTSHPSLESGADQSAAALPPANEPIATGHASTAANESLPSWPPVMGAVARSNGTRPLEHTAEPAQSEQSSPAREEHAV